MDGQLPFEVIGFLGRGWYLLNGRGWWDFPGGVRLAWHTLRLRVNPSRRTIGPLFPFPYGGRLF